VILRSGHRGDGFQFESMPGYFVAFWLCVLQHSTIVAAEEPTYYVSSFMASRVDDLRGDPVSRLHNSIEFIQHLCAHHNVSAEVIIVEWNPFKYQSALSDALRSAVNTCLPIPVCAITVSPSSTPPLRPAPASPSSRSSSKTSGRAARAATSSYHQRRRRA
jgi:hypothetical protein